MTPLQKQVMILINDIILEWKFENKPLLTI